MPTGRLAKWQILITEFDIVYVTQTAMNAQALADHLAENPVDEDYEPLKKLGVKAIFGPGTPTSEIVDFIKSHVK